MLKDEQDWQPKKSKRQEKKRRFEETIKSYEELDVFQGKDPVTIIREGRRKLKL